MNQWARTSTIVIVFLIAILACAESVSAKKPRPTSGVVLVAELSGTISPAAAQYLDRALRAAEQRNAVCLVIQLDTPGGLLTSTRQIVKRIINSDTPVIVYVSPSGSRAASAGVFVTLCSHVAAMAPGTTIGAAHPINIGSPGSSPTIPSTAERRSENESADDTSSNQSSLEQKTINDTVSWARAIAELRDRNAEWAEQTVSESLSVTAAEAKTAKAIDLVATDLDDLLTQLDGREVETPAGTVTLATDGTRIERIPMWWGEQVMAILGHPNVAFMLMVFGFYGILFELYDPGWGIPGTLGLLFMLLGLGGLAVLPVNYLGLALLIAALALFAAEIFVTSYGALAAGGTVCLILSGVMLVDSPAGFTRVSLTVLLPVAAAMAAIVIGLAAGVARTLRRPVRTGGGGLIGETAVVVNEFQPRDDAFRGEVKVHGERWRAVAQHRLQPRQTCQVASWEGLTLHVEPATTRDVGNDQTRPKQS